MSRKSVLVVEDDEEFAETILGFELEKMGYAVQVASNLESARRALKEHVFSLVTVDMCLDEDRETLEGESVLEYILAEFGHIPCIVISGSPLPREVTFNMSRQYPMIADYGYLDKKGFNLRRFKDLVHRILHTRTPDGAVEVSREEVGVQAVDGASGESTPRRRYLAGLRLILETCFDEGELRALCFDLDVDYESLLGEGKANKARELVSFLERRDRVPELVRIGRQMRPGASWGDAP
jgi:DNA-binding NtrC family response regulator